MPENPKEKKSEASRTSYTVNTGPELRTALQRVAEETGQSMNAVCRGALQEFADRHTEPSDERKEHQVQTHSRSFGILLAQLKAAQDKAADEGEESEKEILGEVIGNVEKLRERLEAAPSDADADADDDAPVEMKWGSLIGVMVALLLLTVGVQVRGGGGGPQITR